MVEISHLVVNGCSFTYGQGLNNPQLDAWPALLAKKLNVPVVNLSSLGSGCDGIYRRTIEYFYKNLDNGSKPFYIISWSAATRREEFLHIVDGKEHNDYSNLHVFRPSTNLERELLTQFTEHTERALEKRKYNYWINILNLLQNHNVSYFMNDAMPCDFSMKDYLENEHTKIYNLCVNDKYKLLDNRELLNDNCWLPCGHINEQGNKILADYMYSEFMKIYTDYKIIHTNYLKLKDFPVDKINWTANRWK